MTRALQGESFSAMGTICAVAATAGPRDVTLARRALDAAQLEVAACERALSRFDARSDLSRLNLAGGAWVAVDTRLVDALAAALRARTDTRGRFDPTILPALAAAGYDRSFELLTERAALPLDGWHAGARVDVDPGSGKARVERGAAVDLGGIGKGFAATRALHAMRTAWPALTGALVDLGGDIAVWGTPPEGGPWRVDIADPRAPDRVAGTLELTSGGVATSGRDTRRFGPGGRLHHLIDPATGVPAARGPLSVTVVAASATDAEAHATALAVTDVDEARDHVASRPDVAALLIPELGEPIAIGHLPLVRERPRARFLIPTLAGGSPWH
jgi:thiamine biosynthesis lipoprotein